jgi:hypothetical protein
VRYKCFIGIDPGKKGGIVVLHRDGQIREKLPVPLLEVSSKRNASGKKKMQFDGAGMSAILERYMTDSFVGIERQHAFPLEMGGTSSIGSQMLCYGLWMGAIYALRIPHAIVRAEMWQGAIGWDHKIPAKDRSVINATKLWPKEDWRLNERCRKPHDGYTDAALIAKCCQMFVEKGKERFIQAPL